MTLPEVVTYEEACKNKYSIVGIRINSSFKAFYIISDKISVLIAKAPFGSPEIIELPAVFLVIKANLRS